MKSIVPVLSLLGLSIAHPYVIVDRGTANAESRYSAETLQSCNAAPNCQVSDGPFGLSIGFVPGEEPGSAKYANRFPDRSGVGDWTGREIIKARGELEETGPHTKLEMGNKTVNWGTYEPYDAIEQLKKVCGESSCDTGGIKLKSKTADTQCELDLTLDLRPQGQYNGVEYRDNFIEALKAIAAQGIDSSTVEWWGMLDPNNDMCGWGQHREHRQSNFFSVSKWDGNFMQGFINVRMEAKEENGSCDRVLDALSAAAGAVNGIAGGFFGLLKNIC